jgi:hypothetical protein
VGSWYGNETADNSANVAQGRAQAATITAIPAIRASRARVTVPGCHVRQGRDRHRTDRADPVPLPFTVATARPGLGDTFEPTGTHRLWSLRIPPGEPFVRAGLHLTDHDRGPRYGTLTISAESDGEHSYRPGTGNSVVNGRRAYDSGTGTVIVFEHAAGFTVEITGPAEADLVPLAGAVTIVDGAADEAAWTADYLLS